MSLLMRLLTRRGRKAEGLSTPTTRTSATFARETSEEEGVRGRQAEYPDDEKARDVAGGLSACRGVSGCVRTPPIERAPRVRRVGHAFVH